MKKSQVFKEDEDDRYWAVLCPFCDSQWDIGDDKDVNGQVGKKFDCDCGKTFKIK